MKFSLDKCATLVLKRGKFTKFHGISLPDGRVLKVVIKGAGHKYQIIPQADQIQCP